MQPPVKPMRLTVGEAAAGFREAVTNMPLRLNARFVVGLSGVGEETVDDAIIRPAVVAALNGLLEEGMQRLVEGQVTVKRQACMNGAFITMRVEADAAVLQHLSAAVEQRGALEMDWGRKSAVLAFMQPGGDAALADMLLEVACDGPIKPTALVRGLRHNGVDAKWAVRVHVPDPGQGTAHVQNPWGPDEVMAQPPEALVRSVGGRDDSYSYLVLASGRQLSQQKVSEMVAASQGTHRGVQMGGEKQVDPESLTLRVRVQRLLLHVPPLEGAQLGQRPQHAAQGPASKRVAPSFADVVAGGSAGANGARNVSRAPTAAGGQRGQMPAPVRTAATPAAPAAGGPAATAAVEAAAVAGVGAVATPAPAPDGPAAGTGQGQVAADPLTATGGQNQVEQQQQAGGQQELPAATAVTATTAVAGVQQAVAVPAAAGGEPEASGGAGADARVRTRPPEPHVDGVERGPKERWAPDVEAMEDADPDLEMDGLAEGLTTDPSNAAPANAQ